MMRELRTLAGMNIGGTTVGAAIGAFVGSKQKGAPTWQGAAVGAAIGHVLGGGLLAIPGVAIWSGVGAGIAWALGKKPLVGAITGAGASAAVSAASSAVVYAAAPKIAETVTSGFNEGEDESGFLFLLPLIKPAAKAVGKAAKSGKLGKKAQKLSQLGKKAEADEGATSPVAEPKTGWVGGADDASKAKVEAVPKGPSKSDAAAAQRAATVTNIMKSTGSSHVTMTTSTAPWSKKPPTVKVDEPRAPREVQAPVIIPAAAARATMIPAFASSSTPSAPPAFPSYAGPSAPSAPSEAQDTYVPGQVKEARRALKVEKSEMHEAQQHLKTAKSGRRQHRKK